MTENEAGPTPDAPRGDRRPRPQFGELAPEGWEWKPETPPEPVTRAADHRPVHDATGDFKATRQPAAPPDAATPGPTKPVPSWDRPLALSLLVLSAFGVAMAWGMLGSLTDALQMYHEQFELPDFVPAASVGAILLIGSIVQGALWAGTIWFTIMRLRQRRRAAWIPLTAGVVSVLLLFVFYAIVISTDTVLLENASKLGF